MSDPAVVDHDVATVQPITNLERGRDVIKQAVKNFPLLPGVYRMLGKDGEILYVGKAKNLKNRVTSYTHIHDLILRIQRMVSQVYNVVFTVTPSESAALFLEADLIRTLKPPFNVALKDSTPFASISISKHHDFPRIGRHRGAFDPENEDYCGPFSSVKSVEEALLHIYKIFQLRNCSDAYFAKRTRPCLQYDIKRCCAPCVGKISREDYALAVQHGKDFLAGKIAAVRNNLIKEMQDASHDLAFEKAARLRDTIRNLEKLSDFEKETTGDLANADVIVLKSSKDSSKASGEIPDESSSLLSSPPRLPNDQVISDLPMLQDKPFDPPPSGSRPESLNSDTPDTLYFETDEDNAFGSSAPCVHVLIIRNGLYLGGDTFFLNRASNSFSDEENISSFLQQFYLDRQPPKRILLNIWPSEARSLEEALRAHHHVKVRLETPKKGTGRKWIQIALKNATAQSRYEQARLMDFSDNLKKMAQVFLLPKVPQRVEIYDNSHIQGTNSFGCYVVATPNGFEKKSYRKFSVTPRRESSEHIQGGDDFAMMEEVMQRRFKKDNPDPLPDLLLIDGGAGQVSSVIKILTDYGLDSIPVIGIAKGPDRNAGNERFFIPGWPPISLNHEDPSLYFIQRLRDEAHRFAIGTHRSARSRAMTQSQLNTIPGVGPVRKKQLLQKFGSVSRIRQASIEEICNIEGISESLAKTILKALR